MPLALFALVINRWKPSGLVHDNYESYRQLAEFLPQDLFETRMATIRQLIRNEYPNIYPDTYMFMTAVLLVIATAAFSIIARGLEISMWYPLLILFAPAFLAYWTTRRRSMHYLKLNRFQDSLHTCLKDMTSADISRQIKWNYRRLRVDDTAQELRLCPPLSSWTIELVIEVIQIDPETDLAREMGETLPSYRAAVQDVVLDIGPSSQGDLDGGCGNNYSDLLLPREMDLSDMTRIHPVEPPPAYERGNTDETTTLAPPAYSQSHSTQIHSTETPPRRND